MTNLFDSAIVKTGKTANGKDWRMVIGCWENRMDRPERKPIMRTGIFAYELNRKQFDGTLLGIDKEQSPVVLCSYKVRKRRELRDTLSVLGS